MKSVVHKQEVRGKGSLARVVSYTATISSRDASPQPFLKGDFVRDLERATRQVERKRAPKHP